MFNVYLVKFLSKKWSWRGLNPRLTSKQYAFYMLSPRLVFVKRKERNNLIPQPYPFEVSDRCNGNIRPIPDIPTPPIQPASGQGQLGDVSSPLLE